VQHLTKDELHHLLAAARAHSHREWLAILVGFWHGLRVSELTGPKGFTPAAVRDGYITIQRLKGSMKTSQPLIEHADPLLNEKAALVAFVEFADPAKPVFDFTRQRFWTIMQTHCKTAGIAEHKAHPHVLKHTIAMQTIKSAGIENVRQYLGHRSISSTGAYLKVDDEQASQAIAGAIK
jgi:integrase